MRDDHRAGAALGRPALPGPRGPKSFQRSWQFVAYLRDPLGLLLLRAAPDYLSWEYTGRDHLVHAAHAGAVACDRGTAVHPAFPRAVLSAADAIGETRCAG